jgi:hypothetical protein
MGCVENRPTNQTGCTKPVFDGGKSKGIYLSPTDSAKDFILYLTYVNFPVMVGSAESYVHELKRRNYFEISESEYLTRLKSWL